MQKLALFPIVLVFIVSPLPAVTQNASAITNFNGGRLGDRTKVCCKAKWLARKYGIPFLYTDYKLFDDLMLSVLEKKYDPEIHTFKKIVEIRNEAQIDLKSNDATLYVVMPGSLLLGGKRLDEVMAKDAVFRAMCKKLISSKVPLKKTVVIPKDKISVAVHVRKGGGYDRLFPQQGDDNGKVPLPRHQCADVRFPLKFPPDQYYIDQIALLFKLCDKKPLHVHIFTDDKNPLEIVQRYQTALNNTQISFSCREANNTYHTNVLEDLFTMMDFECLIRPDSGFSQTADFFGHHTLVIAPKSHKWQGNKLIIDKVFIKDRRSRPQGA